MVKGRIKSSDTYINNEMSAYTEAACKFKKFV